MVKCGIARVYEAMPDEDKKALTALIAAPIAAQSVALELQSAGYKMSYQIVYRHRTKMCSCGADGKV